MKDIKDYIHLYIGCEVVRKKNHTQTAVLKGISASEVEEGKFVSIVDVGADQFHEWYVDETIPILRRLSSMTDEEMDEVWYSQEPMNVLVMDYKNSGLTRKVALCSERTRYLLSKGFDLFGLIDSNLAIDSSTITENKHTYENRD